MKKKLTLLLVLLLGGILVMTACTENKNSREWIENNFSEQLSRVYMTRNIEELFTEFPDGFTLYQVYTFQEGKKNYHVTVNLTGDASSKSISGTLEKVLVTTKPFREKMIKSTQISYEENQFTFSDPVTASQLWQFKGFLFQQFEINKKVLSKMEMQSKSFSEMNSSFDIDYIIIDSNLNNFFQKAEGEEATLTLGSSLRNDDYYYYSVVVDYGDGHFFRETVSNESGE